MRETDTHRQNAKSSSRNKDLALLDQLVKFYKSMLQDRKKNTPEGIQLLYINVFLHNKWSSENTRFKKKPQFKSQVRGTQFLL